MDSRPLLTGTVPRREPLRDGRGAIYVDSTQAVLMFAVGPTASTAIVSRDPDISPLVRPLIYRGSVLVRTFAPEL
jgi:hypothetical protein